MNAEPDLWTTLSREDLEGWAGPSVVSRGASYQRSGRVQDLVLTAQGALLAWVEGTRRYATQVIVQTGPVLDSVCTCPYAGHCKHAVAVVLEAQKCLQAGEALPQANLYDPRLQLLAPLASGASLETLEADSTPARDLIRHYLDDQDKAALITLIENLAERFPGVHAQLLEQATLERGSDTDLLHRTTAMIENLAAEPDWDDYHYGGFDNASFEDLARLPQHLEMLLARGHADEVVALGDRLLAVGARRVELEPEGESHPYIAEGLTVAYRALPLAYPDPADQMFWAFTLEQEDGYGLCDEASAEFWRREFPPAAWSRLADALLERLRRTTGKVDDFVRNYQRDRIGDRLITALEKAGRSEEILPLCEREAGITGNYTRLVDRLLAAGREEQAVHWIETGITATQDRYPGLADALLQRFQQLLEQRRDWPQLAAIAADGFIRSPRLSEYQNLQQAAEKAGVGSAVRDLALRYLQTGQDPRQARRPRWPLPAPRLTTDRRRSPVQFPVVDTLIEIAIAEGRPDQVLHWYEQRQSRPASWQRLYNLETRVADVLAADYPDQAVAIWQRLVEDSIAQTNDQGYQAAAHYLRKIQPLLQTDTWNDLLRTVRERHKRKRKLLALLDTL